MTTPKGENQDVTIDLRTIQTPETNEIFSDSFAIEAIKKIMIIGIAARQSEIDILRMHWTDRYRVEGEPLQEVALESLRDAAIVGLDRLGGDYGVYSPAHSVFDQLFDHSEDKTHAGFIERLSWMSQNTWKLFNFKDYTLSIDQEKKFVANGQGFTRSADQLFHDCFYVVATSENVPSRYTNLIDHTLGQEIASLYLDKKYIIDKLKNLRATRLHNKDAPKGDVRFYEWMLQQEQRMRFKKLGKFATSSRN